MILKDTLKNLKILLNKILNNFKNYKNMKTYYSIKSNKPLKYKISTKMESCIFKIDLTRDLEPSL